jgi:putative transcriptional regulator
MSPARSCFCRKHVMAGALGALLLLNWPVPPRAADESQPLNAILIVARGELRDPNFADSVVLVMNHLGPAPVGLVINRPTEIPVSRLFPQVKHLAARDRLYFGGPVELTSVWFLFHAAHAPQHAVQAFGSIYLSADRDLLMQLLARDKPMDNLRIFIGHSGWAPGQLEAEIAAGAWTLEHADAAAIFGGKAEHPWPAPASAGPDRST